MPWMHVLPCNCMSNIDIFADIELTRLLEDFWLISLMVSVAYRVEP